MTQTYSIHDITLVIDKGEAQLVLTSNYGEVSLHIELPTNAAEGVCKHFLEIKYGASLITPDIFDWFKFINEEGELMREKLLEEAESWLKAPPHPNGL